MEPVIQRAAVNEGLKRRVGKDALLEFRGRNWRVSLRNRLKSLFLGIEDHAFGKPSVVSLGLHICL